MFCKYCGKQIREGVSFCPVCGKKLADGNTFIKHEEPVSANYSKANHSDKTKITNIMKAAVLVLLIVAVVLIVVNAVTKNSGSKALIGAWRFSTSGYSGTDYESYDYQIIFYSSGSFNDRDGILEEDFDSDGNINSWEEVSNGTIALKDNYGYTYVLDYKIQSGVLTLTDDYGWSSTFKRVN